MEPKNLPGMYATDRRNIKPIVKYCGVRFRAAVEGLLKLDRADARNLEPLLGKEMAST